MAKKSKIMLSEQDALRLDTHYPPCGECLLCGHHDKRHRLWDTLMHFYELGYTPEQIHEEFPGISIDHINTVIELRPYKKK